MISSTSSIVSFRICATDPDRSRSLMGFIQGFYVCCSVMSSLLISVHWATGRKKQAACSS
jgi:hypothetical protein